MADFRGYMIGSFASSRLDRGGIPVVATTGKVSDASAAEPTVDFGINPCQWNSLPPEGILLWKVRHPVTETEADYPATIVLPSGLSTTTPVTVSNAGVIVNKTPIVDKVGAHMTGQDITTPVASGDPVVGAYTEHLVYYNKCTGVFRMLGHTATAATAPSA